MDKGIWAGGYVDSGIIDKVKMRLDFEYNGLIPQTALYRILLGMFADGLVNINPEDVRLYSPVSLQRGRPNQKP